MRIDIWSDVVCPWCYIGKRRLETALRSFPHRDQVEVVWHSFQLDPGAPTEVRETSREMLARKYGMSPAQAAQAEAQVSALAAEEGMAWAQEGRPHVNTLDAHRLLHLALADGGPEAQGALKEALLSSYFVGAENVADHAVLRRVAVDTGLDATRVDEVLSSSEYTDEVWADQQQAGAYGATGVPFYVIDRRYGVSGAQPADAFTQVLERAWSDSHPAIEMVGVADSDGACGPDGCAI